MEEDEGGDNDGIASDLTGFDIRVQECALVEVEIEVAGQKKAAHDESDYAYEDEGT